MYNFGDIVLVPFPFTDLSSQKLRPAMVVSRKESVKEDVLLVFITSKTKNKENEMEMNPEEKKFKNSGLKVISYARFDKIATLSKKVIIGKLGEVSIPLLREEKEKFCHIFGF